MNGTTGKSTVFGCTVVLALILVSALTADVDAIGLYSVIARVAEADVHIVVLVPDEERNNGNGGVNDRIRFTCDINYRLPGNTEHEELERRSLIVTDRFIGLVTVTGNHIPEKPPATAREKDATHPFTAVRRFVGRQIRRYSVPLAWCLKAAMAAAQRLITGYFDDLN
jgi:hypothetical protein